MDVPLSSTPKNNENRFQKIPTSISPFRPSSPIPENSRSNVEVFKDHLEGLKLSLGVVDELCVVDVVDMQRVFAEFIQAGCKRLAGITNSKPT